MSLAKFASLHGGLLARKGRATPASVHHGIDFAVSKFDGRALGEGSVESQSVQESPAPRSDLSDRIQNLNGDLAVPLNGHKHSPDAEMLTPEPGSPEETEIQAGIADAPKVASETDQRIQEAIDARLAALAVEPENAVERSELDQSEQPERRADEPWDGIERRKNDRGLAPSVPERRKPPVFGKRGAARTPVPDISQKRFNT